MTPEWIRASFPDRFDPDLPLQSEFVLNRAIVGDGLERGVSPLEVGRATWLMTVAYHCVSQKTALALFVNNAGLLAEKAAWEPMLCCWWYEDIFRNRHYTSLEDVLTLWELRDAAPEMLSRVRGSVLAGTLGDLGNLAEVLGAIAATFPDKERRLATIEVLSARRGPCPRPADLDLQSAFASVRTAFSQ
jgi:hypothetical protein